MALEFLQPEMVPFLSTFLLVFAVVFGLLAYSNVGKFGKNVNALIALAISLFSIFYPPLVEGLNQFMPVVVAVLLVLFFIAFIKKIFEEKKDKHHDMYPMIVTLGILLLLLGVLGDRFLPFLPAGVEPSTFLWGIGIIIVLVFFWAVYKHQGVSAAAGRPP